MPSYKKISKETVISAIENSQGLFSKIAKRLGCKSETAERLCHRWKETEQALTNETNFVLDLAESKVFKAINDGDMATVKWFLAMKGKNRGYISTPTFKLENTEPLNINFEGLTKADLLSADNIEINMPNEKEETSSK